MFRRLLLLIALAAAGAACHHEPPVSRVPEADLPPLPPSSGTPVGYLIDASSELKLSSVQVEHLKSIDSSLAARDAQIDTQLRQLDQPEQEDPHAPKHHKSHAPGADVQQTGDSAKLHEMRNANDRDAIQQAFALLDDAQRSQAAKILEAHDVAVPGAPKRDQDTSDDGAPLPPQP